MIIGVLFTVLELRNLVKTRPTDMVIRSYSTLGSREFQESWDKFIARGYKDFKGYMKEYGLSEINVVGLFFSGIDVLLIRKLIDISLVEELFRSPIKMTWEKMKPIAEGYRKHFNQPTIGRGFEHLYNEIIRREQKLQQTQQ